MLPATAGKMNGTFNYKEIGKFGGNLPMQIDWCESVCVCVEYRVNLIWLFVVSVLVSLLGKWGKH